MYERISIDLVEFPMDPANLLTRVRDELARIHGKEYAQACSLEYHRGWFYLSIEPQRVGQSWIANPTSKAMRREELEKFLAALQEQPS